MAERRPSLDFLKSLSVNGGQGGQEPGPGGEKAERRPSLDFLKSLNFSGGLGGAAGDQTRPRRSSMIAKPTGNAPASNKPTRQGRRSSMMANLGGRTNYDNPSDTTERRSSAPSKSQSGGGFQKRRGSFGSLTAFARMEAKEVQEDGDKLYEAALNKAKAQEWEGAIRLLNRALIAQRKEFGQDHPKVASTLNSIGVALTNLGETFGAMTAFQEALYIRQETLGAGHEDVVKTMNNIHKLLEVVQLIENESDDDDDHASGDEGGGVRARQLEGNQGLEKYRDEESSDSEISTDSDDDDSDFDDDDELCVGFPSR